MIIPERLRRAHWDGFRRDITLFVAVSLLGVPALRIDHFTFLGEPTMQSRIEYAKAAPGAAKAMRALELHVHECGLERTLLELVKTRASQINGCAYCLDMHTKNAGETKDA
jgi:AhpD family alkylhydroperoxidase